MNPLPPNSADAWASPANASPVILGPPVVLGSTNEDDGASGSNRDNALADAAMRTLAGVIELQTRLERCADVDAAVEDAARFLLAQLNATSVAIGLSIEPDSPCHVLWEASRTVGTDAVAVVAPDASCVAAMDEVLRRGERVRVPALDTDDQFGTLAIQRYASESSATTLLSAPLIDKDGLARGAILVIDAVKSSANVSAETFVESCTVPLTEKLLSVAHHRPSRIEQAIRTLSTELIHRKSMLAAGLIAICALMMLPWKYQLRCRCELQPTGKRFVVAPIDAPLESSRVRAGDIVKAGDVLATMNAREIDIELAALRAELLRSQQQADNYLADNNAGETQLAQLEAQRLSLQTDLLLHRRESLEIKSPVDGVVVAGDLRDTEGAPLSRGQTLFEIAPLGRLYVEVSVPQSEIAYVDHDMRLNVRLHAYPDQVFSTRIERIEPSAQVRDQDNVFLAEATIEDAQQLLRPGMKGRAWVDAGSAPLGWIWFHRPIASLRVTLGY